MDIRTRETLAQAPAPSRPAAGLRLGDHLRIIETAPGRTVVEFSGTADFSAQWYSRQKYEIDAGRAAEPLLYTDIYQTISDPNLPRTVRLLTMEGDGVVFEAIKEGGEVKFLSVSGREATVGIEHFAVGLTYHKDLLTFNELWNLPIIERAAGIAFNALLNHLHLSPFLSATYPTANQTAAVSVTGASLAENVLRTVEAGVSAAIAATSPRRGPYALLVSSSNLFTVERALTTVAQQGIAQASSAIGRIQRLIAYDGWTGTRGNLTTTYPGVAPGSAYLIDLSHKQFDHVSYEKQGLLTSGGSADLSRFILEQVVFDAYYGVYCAPTRSTQKITLPSA